MRRSSRRHRAQDHGNHERWLVSYADFITLLFAFFVVMFASTQANQAKAISDSVRTALDQGQLSAMLSAVLGRKSDAEPAKERPRPDTGVASLAPVKAEAEPNTVGLKESLKKLQAALEQELKEDKIKLTLESRGLVVSLRESAFFGSGDDAVSPASLSALAKITAVIRDLPNPIRLEGHTDSFPIHNSRFRSNWELSSARAIAMLELLRDRFEIPAGQMSVAGYAENAPADTNETQQGRAHNRRVDLVLLSAEGMKSEPQ